METISTYASPIGTLTLAASGEHLVGLWTQGQKHFGAKMDGSPTQNDALPVFAAARDWLDRYFAGLRPAGAELPLAPAGSDFRRAVWAILSTIPYGETMTYGEIGRRVAEQTGRPGLSAQAVGGAVAHNPISIIIPCHRVVGASGSLTGYAGGLPRKTWLLRHERVNLAQLHLPQKGTAL